MTSWILDGTVYLVDHDDDAVTHLHRLSVDEPRLRHGTFRGVHEKDDSVHHLEYSLDLASEIRVSGGVDYVYLHAVIFDRRVLCKDSYPALALEVARVHDSFRDSLVFVIFAALLEHFVDEGRLAVVDVRDDRYVS